MKTPSHTSRNQVSNAVGMAVAGEWTTVAELIEMGVNPSAVLAAAMRQLILDGAEPSEIEVLVLNMEGLGAFEPPADVSSS